MGASTEGDDAVVLQGDNTAYSVVVSRYMLALQHEHGGLVLDDAEAGLRTACPDRGGHHEDVPDHHHARRRHRGPDRGDIDEAVSGLLTNGLAAGDVNGESVPAGFSRIDAFRVGVLGDVDRCYKRFP